MNSKTDEPVERRQNETLFQELLDRFEQHEKEEAEKYKRLISAQQTNTDAITALTESVSKVVEGTSSIIQLQNDFRSAARLGNGLQGFMLWLLKWGFIGAGVATAIDWVVNQFN